MGDISFVEEDGYLIFRRLLPVLNAQPADNSKTEAGGDDLPPEMIEAFFEGITWVYEVTFPGTIAASNAREEDVDLQANTIRWSFSASDLLRSGAEMWAKIAL